jgi:hypothetical protein
MHADRIKVADGSANLQPRGEGGGGQLGPHSRMAWRLG